MKANRKLRNLKDDEAGNVQTAQAVMAVILLIVGFAVAGLLYTFTQVLGGQTYELVEDDIDAITNTTIQDAIRNGIISNFEAQQQIGDYMPIIALAIIITIVIGLIIGGIASRFMTPAMFGGGYGGGISRPAGQEPGAGPRPGHDCRRAGTGTGPKNQRGHREQDRTQDQRRVPGQTGAYRGDGVEVGRRSGRRVAQIPAGEIQEGFHGEGT